MSTYFYLIAFFYNNRSVADKVMHNCHFSSSPNLNLNIHKGLAKTCIFMHENIK